MLLACTPCAALAQQTAASSSPVATAFVNNMKNEGKNLVAAAEEMPADKYSFRPTPAQMSFGQIVLHLAEGNDTFCSNLVGSPMPTRSAMDTTASKAKMVARLRETFDYCNTQMAKLNDSALGEVIPLYGKRKAPRATVMIVATGDWSDHYSQSAIYLRLNGLLPPTARRAPAAQAGASKAPAKKP
jgi:hypothetical protein